MSDYTTYLDKLRAGCADVNPFLDFMEIRREEIAEGYARFRMPVRPYYIQGAGLMQGGVMVAMADETIAHAIMPLLKGNEDLTTVELKSNFLAPVKEGELVAEATVFKRGKTIIIGDCHVKDDQERPVLRCTATFLVTPGKAKSPGNHQDPAAAGTVRRREDERQTNLF